MPPRSSVRGAETSSIAEAGSARKLPAQRDAAALAGEHRCARREIGRQPGDVIRMRMRSDDMRDAAARRGLLDDCADFPGFLGTDRRVKYRHGICADDEAGVIARGRSVDTIRAVTERHRAQGPPLGSLHIARRQIKRARIDIRRDDRRAFPAVPQVGTAVGRNALRLQRVARLAVVFIDEAFVAGRRGFHELRCRIDGDDGCPACPIFEGHVHVTARVIDRKVRCSHAGVGQQQTWRQIEQVAELLGAGRFLSPVDFVAIAPADEVDRCPGGWRADSQVVERNRHRGIPYRFRGDSGRREPAPRSVDQAPRRPGCPGDSPDPARDTRLAWSA